eukprot:10709398-Heterocapsa_arctica.AAC.1
MQCSVAPAWWGCPGAVFGAPAEGPAVLGVAVGRRADAFAAWRVSAAVAGDSARAAAAEVAGGLCAVVGPGSPADVAAAPSVSAMAAAELAAWRRVGVGRPAVEVVAAAAVAAAAVAVVVDVGWLRK